MSLKITQNIKLAVCAPFRKSKHKYSGCNHKTVTILANGPSLKDSMETILSTDSVLVLNNFFLHENFLKFKPQYYVIVDPMYFEEKLWRGLPDENIYKVIEEIDWDITFFIPYKYYAYFKNKVENPKVQIKTIYRYPCIHRLIPKALEFFLYRKGISAPTSQNVLIPSIYAMINAGYNEIYLYGTDHSWTSQITVNESNQVCLTDHHFYDDEEPRLSPWLKASGLPYKMHEILNDLKTTFSTYHELSDYASEIGSVKIVNKTKKSFIDAFIKE